LERELLLVVGPANRLLLVFYSVVAGFDERAGRTVPDGLVPVRERAPSVSVMELGWSLVLVVGMAWSLSVHLVVELAWYLCGPAIDEVELFGS
jgi:hypothetical protein